MPRAYATTGHLLNQWLESRKGTLTLIKMGQCLSCCKDKDRRLAEGVRTSSYAIRKQDKNIDDKRMFKLGIDVLNRDFCIQIGYNRKAVKTYGPQNGAPEDVVS